MVHHLGAGASRPTSTTTPPHSLTLSSFYALSLHKLCSVAPPCSCTAAEPLPTPWRAVSNNVLYMLTPWHCLPAGPDQAARSGIC